MRFREIIEGGDWEADVADKLRAKFAKMKTDVPKSQRPAPKDPHPDKSMIWKKGFADGKAGRMDPKASNAYGPRTTEYEDGYEAGSKAAKESVTEMSASSVAAVAMPVGPTLSRQMKNPDGTVKNAQDIDTNIMGQKKKSKRKKA